MAGVLRQYQGDSLYLAAFAVCLVLLYWKEKKQGGSTGKKALAAAALSVVFVFNEAAYQIVGKITYAATYYRFFWMLPVLFLIAYELTEAFFDGRRNRLVLGALAFAVCLGFGANLFFLNRANFNLPKNMYGLDQNVMPIADAMLKDWQETDGGSQQELPRAAFDIYLEYQMRTYEPRILWAISRNAYLYQAKHGYDFKKYVHQQHMIAAVNEGLKMNQQALRRSLDKNGVDYLVIRTEFDMDSYLSQISIMPVTQSEDYTLYRVKTAKNNDGERKDLGG